MQAEGTDELRTECRMITRYLVGQEPPPEILERYVRANHILLVESSKSDKHLIRYVHKHPWSLPYLDAACALLRRDCLLRNKILILLALLETSPSFVQYFLPERSSVPSTLGRLIMQGMLATGALELGISIYPFALNLR